jgi:hypothetical protein
MSSSSKKSPKPTLRFSKVCNKKVEADFEGGAVTSDGGLLLLGEADRKLGFTQAIASHIQDDRQQAKVRHDVATMLRQRVMAVASGWEDLNDATTLRNDPAHQIASGTDAPMASAPTLCRLENKQKRSMAWAVHKEMVEQFIKSFTKPPRCLILDFDLTDTPLHGEQERRFFNAYYDSYCYLPLYVFCGDRLLVSYLRPSSGNSFRHTAAILKILVTRFRQIWPKVKIVFRGDSGFCRDLLLSWCDRHDIKYLVGIGKNPALLAELADSMAKAKADFEKTKLKQRVFEDFDYRTGSWKWTRRIVGKAEHTAEGANPRFIVTNLVGNAQRLYEHRYCARGEMENKIKEQMMLHADRMSAHQWWANQWRLLISAMAYTLMEAVRRLCLAGTELAKATCSTIRTKLIKIGAVIVAKSTVIRFHLTSHHPLKQLITSIVEKLVPI